MSNTMREFLEAYLAYAISMDKDEEPEHYFLADTGLCYNSVRWQRIRGYGDDCESLLEELELMFSADGLDSDFPFGEDDYRLHHANDMMWASPLRIDWIESKLGA